MGAGDSHSPQVLWVLLVLVGSSFFQNLFRGTGTAAQAVVDDLKMTSISCRNSELPILLS
jgi:hypothetical protein